VLTDHERITVQRSSDPQYWGLAGWRWGHCQQSAVDPFSLLITQPPRAEESLKVSTVFSCFASRRFFKNHRSQARHAYFSPRINTTSFFVVPRTMNSRDPSADQLKLEISGEVNRVSCVGLPPASGNAQMLVAPRVVNK
jgi:hypothetical protein